MDSFQVSDGGCALCTVHARLQSSIFNLKASSLIPPEWERPSKHMGALRRSEIEQHVEFLGKCVADLDKAIDALMQRRKDLVREKHSYQNLFPPVLQMPTEIHSLIFQHCISDWVSQMSTLQDKNPWVMSPRRLITQICRSWRTTAIASPELWCDIEVIEYLWNRGNGPLADELALSKNLPLRIFFSASNTGFGETVKDNPEIFESLVQTRHRWVSFDASHYFHDFFSFMEEPGPTPKFPLLRSIGGKVASKTFFLRQNIDPADTPLLEDIHLDFQYYYGEEPPVFPWLNLRHIKFSGASHSCMAAILFRLSSITRLELALDNCTRYKPTAPPSSDRPIHLSSVETLTIRVNSHNRLVARQLEVIPQLRLPALKKLSLTGLYDFGPVISMLNATQFPASPRGGVRVLELDSLNFDWNSMMLVSFEPFFHHLRNLTTLTIRHLRAQFCHNLLWSLMFNPGAGVNRPCPSLEQFSITDGFFDPEILERFITSRLSWEENRFTRLIVDSSHLSVSGTYRWQDIEGLVLALKAFGKRPTAQLRVDIHFKITQNGKDTPRHLYIR